MACVGALALAGSTVLSKDNSSSSDLRSDFAVATSAQGINGNQLNIYSSNPNNTPPVVDDTAEPAIEFKKEVSNDNEANIGRLFNNLYQTTYTIPTPKVPHEEYRRAEPETSNQSDVTLFQFEDRLPSIVRLDNDGNITIDIRHCEAAASIQESTAQNIFNGTTDFNVDCLGYLITGAPLQLSVKNKISSADVITFSYIPDPTRESSGFRNSENDNISSIYRYPELWRDMARFWDFSDTISVQAVGNNSFSNSNSLERGNEFVLNSNDTNLRVGAGAISGLWGDLVVVDSYSSAASPDVITLNPFYSGFRYDNYHPDERDIRRGTREYFSNTRRIENMNECKPPRRFINNARLDDAAERISRCIINMEEFEDMQDLNTSNLRGTSFTAPVVSGIIAAGKQRVAELHGSSDLLTSHDYFAAALIAAQPVDRAKNSGFGYSRLNYVRNGGGLHYNFNLAGFGILTPDRYLSVIEEMASRRANDTVEQTRINVTNFAKTSLNTQSATEDGNHDYTFNLSGDDIMGRMVFMLEFEDPNINGVSAYPERIELISPDGTAITISPSMESPQYEISTFATNGFFGTNIEGEWTIRVKAPHRLKGFESRLISYEPNGVISRVLQDVRRNGTDITYADTNTVQPIRYRN